MEDSEVCRCAQLKTWKENQRRKILKTAKKKKRSWDTKRQSQTGQKGKSSQEQVEERREWERNSKREESEKERH